MSASDGLPMRIADDFGAVSRALSLHSLRGATRWTGPRVELVGSSRPAAKAQGADRP